MFSKLSVLFLLLNKKFMIYLLLSLYGKLEVNNYFYLYVLFLIPDINNS